MRIGLNLSLVAHLVRGALTAAYPRTFDVVLSNPTGGMTIADGTGVGTIEFAASGLIVPVITASRTTGVAPLAITFDALATTAPLLTALPFSEIHYEWRFGDDRGTYWSYGINAGGNNKNIAFGPVAAHVFETSGTFTVELIASHINSAGQLSQTTTTLPNIVVTNADTVFASNTIYISQTGVPVPGQNGVPVGATVQQVASWSTVQTLAQTYKRVLLKRGEVWPNEGNVTLGASHAGPGLIGAYGTGDKPVITNGSIRIQTSDWRVLDLFFTGESVAERTWSYGLSARSGCVDALFLRTDARWCFELTSFVEATGVYLVDSVVGLVSDQAPDARGYASWLADVSRPTMLGTRLHGSNAHTARWQGIDKAVISNCTLNEPKGPQAWSMLTIRGKTHPTDSTVWTGTWTEHVVVSDNLIIAGAPNIYSTFSAAPMNDRSAERLRDVIFERNRVISLATQAATFAVVTGLTVRNNILESLYSEVVLIEAKSIVGSPDMSQAFFYNNTLYRPNATVWPNSSGFAIPSRATGLVIRNNIKYAPLNTTATMFAGTAVEGTNYTQSNNTSNAQIISSLPFVSATPAADSDFAPAGYATGGGVWVPVYENYFKATNTLSRNRGAI